MKEFKKLSKTLLLATALTGVITTASVVPEFSAYMGIQAIAQEYALSSPERAAAAAAASKARPRLGSIPGVGERAGKVLKKVQELMQMEPPQYEEAYTRLKAAEDRIDRFNSTEKAAMYQMLAAATQSLDKMDEALVYYKKILELDGISNTQRDQFMFVVGQLEFSNGNYDIAISYLDQWFKHQANPSMTQIEFLGNVQYTLALEKDGAAAEPYYRRAIEFLDWAILKAKTDDKTVKENWYQVLRAIYNSLEEMDKVLEYSELLATRWPKKQYWTQLSSIYAQMGTLPGVSEDEAAIFEKKQLASFELVHRQGLLETGREFETMAQLYLFHESPYQASKTIGKALDEGISEKTKRNLELYATGLVTGKDLEDAVQPLSDAADLSEDGNLYLQLANVYLNLDNFKGAASSIDKALDKGGLRRPDQSSLLQGQAYLALEEFDKARSSFREAAKDKRSQGHAKNFLKYVDSEEKRIKDIREYLS